MLGVSIASEKNDLLIESSYAADKARILRRIRIYLKVHFKSIGQIHCKEALIERHRIDLKCCIDNLDAFAFDELGTIYARLIGLGVETYLQILKAILRGTGIEHSHCLDTYRFFKAAVLF